MKTSKALIIVSILVGLLAVIQSGVGLFWQNDGRPFDFTTLHGQTVRMYGQGIYAFDTYFRAPISRGTDAVTLFVVVPLLIFALLRYARGSLRGGILLTTLLSYFAYNATSVAMGTAYNNLILVYIAYFSASLFAFVIAIGLVDHQTLAARMTPGLPHGGIATLITIGGLAVFVAWLSDIVSALLAGSVPAIDSYTTEVTYMIDLGLIAPLCFLTAILLLRRAPVSYLIAAILLTLLAIIGLVVLVQTFFQMQAGIILPLGVFIGKAGSFAVLSLFALWMIIRFHRNLGSPQTAVASHLPSA